MFHQLPYLNKKFLCNLFYVHNCSDTMGNKGAFVTLTGSDDLTPKYTTYDAVVIIVGSYVNHSNLGFYINHSNLRSCINHSNLGSYINHNKELWCKGRKLRRITELGVILVCSVLEIFAWFFLALSSLIVLLVISLHKFMPVLNTLVSRQFKINQY